MTELTRREFLISTFAALVYQDVSQPTRILKRADWEKARVKTLEGLKAVMGDLPDFSGTPLEIATHLTEDFPLFTRSKITYNAEPGDFVSAYILVPKKKKGKAPAMICLHETDGIGKNGPVGIAGSSDQHYAKELAERGFVCIVPDYPYLGENRGFDPYLHGYSSCSMKGIVNHMRAVDVLHSLPYVEKNCIGAIGHSLGGHNALFVSCFDERIKAIVTSCGFTSFKKYKGGDLTGWSGPRYMPAIASQFSKDPQQMPFDFSDILVSIAPRPVFISAPLRDENFDVTGVQDCVTIAASVYKRVFRKRKRLIAKYPDNGHEFPEGIRKDAYEFLERWLAC